MAEARGSLLQDTLLRFVRRGAWGHARKLLEKSHSADIAHVLDRLTPADRRSVFDLVRTPETRAEVFALLDYEARADLLGDLDPEVGGGILRLMDPDDAAGVLRQLPSDKAEELLAGMGNDAARVEALLGYEEGTAGAIMLPAPFALAESLTAKEAIERLQQAEQTEGTFYIYVVDDRNHLVGVLSLRQLIRQPPYTLLRESMVTDPIRVTTETDKEEVARVVARYDLLAMPVVDSAGRLVGVVTVDDVIDVMREAATEDMLKMAGTSVEEVTSPTVLRAAWLRFPWLAASFVGGAGGILLLHRFEGMLSQTVQLAFFLPIILGMGGNVGSQCAMVVVRGLATGRLELVSVGRIITHEIGISVMLATAFAGLLGLAAFALGVGPARLPWVVTAGMFVSMLAAATVGTVLPLLFSRTGVDPAVASGPFVTTSTDVIGIAAFFAVAFALL
jgi:magnesium transporter